MEGQASSVWVVNSRPREEDKNVARWVRAGHLDAPRLPSGLLKVLHNRKGETKGESNRVREGCLPNIAP